MMINNTIFTFEIEHFVQNKKTTCSYYHFLPYPFGTLFETFFDFLGISFLMRNLKPHENRKNNYFLDNLKDAM